MGFISDLKLEWFIKTCFVNYNIMLLVLIEAIEMIECNGMSTSLH